MPVSKRKLENRDWLSQSDLARYIGLSRSTIHRKLNSIVETHTGSRLPREAVEFYLQTSEFVLQINKDKAIHIKFLIYLAYLYGYQAKTIKPKAKKLYMHLKEGKALEDFTFVPKKKKKTKAKVQRGYVYFIRCKAWVKIGKAVSVQDRLAALQTGNPYKLELVHKIRCEDAMEGEDHFHEKFKELRGVGEWFTLSDKDLKDIKRIRSMDLDCKIYY